MLELRENPITEEVFLYDPQCNIIYSINGTPFGITSYQIADWERVDTREIPCLFDWQREPGRYGDCNNAKAILTSPDGQSFSAGGSILYVWRWAEDHGYAVTLCECYRDRNAARRVSEVQW